MADEAPVRIVIDCSVPDRAAAVAHTQDQVEAVLKRRTDGKITSDEAAARLVALADNAAEAAGIPDRVTFVELEGDELTEYHERLAAAVDAEASAP